MDQDATWYGGRPLPNKEGTAAALQFSAHVCCGQMAGWIKMSLGMEIGLDPGHIVLNGDPALPQKEHSPPFSSHVCCGQTVGWIKMPLGMEVDLGPGHFVLGVDPAPPKEHSPQFLAHACCGRTAGWIRMPLGTEVGLSQGNIVLDGDPAPPQKGAQRRAPLFSPCQLWQNGRPSQLLLSTCSCLAWKCLI